MKTSKITLALSIAALFAAGAAAAADLTHVPNANPKITGMAAANVLSPELYETIVARGSMALENPNNAYTYYGYDNNGTMLPSDHGSLAEASKTEPDKNAYLVLRRQQGADGNYNYGTHFLFQGHETGTGGYVTRINLDADVAHRVTLIADADVLGNKLPTFDGITWNPFAQRLLLTAEAGNKGGVWQVPVEFSPGNTAMAEDISGALGRGGYEGIQNDKDGNIWIVEDAGGASGTLYNKAKQPNSFIYRFVPYDASNLTQGGKLQALQVMSLASPGQPIEFHAGQADADILSQDMLDLHTYGKVFNTNWVTIHDTAVDGNVPFDANALAKAKRATPLKRPENGQFRPGSQFREFFFDETGDTNLQTQAANYGGFGAVLKLVQANPSANSGKLTMFYKGDAVHSGFDNVAFWGPNQIVFVEDAGDTLHSQRNGFDSAYLFDVNHSYADGSQPVRILALGRDTSATLDSWIGTLGIPFQNEGDNEITGIHVSDGDPTANGLLGAKVPRTFNDGWRVFYTQQHGDNQTFEILPNNQDDGHNGHH
jgi:hypothetical protein